MKCSELANRPSRSNDESAKPAYQEERKPVIFLTLIDAVSPGLASGSPT
ncbi:MAG TPA: hypothetical protein VH593_28785 [Ktedonobacteraceae bacterium]